MSYLSKITHSEIILPIIQENAQDAWHIFNIRHPNRDELKRHLLAHGIGTEIHYPLPPHKQSSCLKLFEDQQYPISELIHRTTLSLPISVFHTEEDVEYISGIINDSKI